MHHHRKGLLLYLVATLGFSSIFYFLIIKSGHLAGASGRYALALMWCPAMAAFLTCKLTGREVGSLGWQWGRSRYQSLSYFIPLAYAAVAYTVVWVTGLGKFYNQRFVDQITRSFGLGSLPSAVSISLYLMLAGTAGMVTSCSAALGEEIGWRGFLVPELASRMSFTKTALLSGCIWSVWHYPILIFADYNAGTPTWYALTCFTALVVADSFVFAWMRLKSGSLWTGMLLHASHNLFIQGFFNPITQDTGHTKYVIGEFGAVLPVTAILFAFYFWTRRAEIEPVKLTASAKAASWPTAEASGGDQRAEAAILTPASPTSGPSAGPRSTKNPA
jgi:uncharacterized protein